MNHVAQRSLEKSELVKISLPAVQAPLYSLEGLKSLYSPNTGVSNGKKKNCDINEEADQEWLNGKGV